MMDRVVYIWRLGAPLLALALILAPTLGGLAAGAAGEGIDYVVAPGDTIEVRGWFLAGCNGSEAYYGGFWTRLLADNYFLDWLPEVSIGYARNVYGELYRWNYTGLGLHIYYFSIAAGHKVSHCSDLMNITYKWKLKVTETIVTRSELAKYMAMGDEWAEKAYVTMMDVDKFYAALLEYDITYMSGSHRIYLPVEDSYNIAVSFVKSGFSIISKWNKDKWHYDVYINGREARVSPVTVTTPETVEVQQGEITSYTIEVTGPRLLGMLSLKLETRYGVFDVLKGAKVKPWGPSGPTVYLDEGDLSMAKDGYAKLIMIIDATTAEPGVYSADVDLYLGGTKLLDAVGSLDNGMVRLAGATLGMDTMDNTEPESRGWAWLGVGFLAALLAAMLFARR